MAIYPGAIVRLIPRHNRARMAAHNRVNLHVAVSEAASLYGFFSGAPVCSHFYVRKNGTVEQYIDTAYRSKADGDGNDATISIETQGGLRNAQGEPWTAAQVASLGSLFAWASRTHGIPARLAGDSRPGESSRGLSWHRLGIDPWRVRGGMKYSSSRGKVCPGDAKIAQIPAVLAAATGASLVSDAVTIPGVSIPTAHGSLPHPLEEDDMYTDDDRARAARIEEHVMAARQHAANAEANSYEAVKLLRAHLEPTRTHASRAEANAYRAVRLIEESQRDLAATEGA